MTESKREAAEVAGSASPTVEKAAIRTPSKVDEPFVRAPAEVTKAPSKHPLQNAWCLWYLPDLTGRCDDWLTQQTLVHQFNTVEDFWCMYNNIHSASNIGNSDYSLFKKGITPAWEDAQLKRGGRWGLRFAGRCRQLDDIWLHVCLSMIGETFDEEGGDRICGAVVKTRKNFSKIELWIADGSERKAMDIGRVFQQLIIPLAEQRRQCDMIFDCFYDEGAKYHLSAN